MSLSIIVMCFTWMVHRLAFSRTPTKYASAASCRVRVCAPGSACHTIPLQGLSPRLNVKREVCKLRGPYFSGIDRSHGKLLSLVHTFGASSLFWPRRIPSGGLASHSWSELPPGWLLPTQCRWPNLCSHLGQLSGWQWPQQPPHLSQLLCLFHSSL